MDEFIQITGASREEAQFFLEANADDLQASIVAYLESRSDAHASSAVNSTPQTSSSANTNSSKQPASREGPRIATFSQLAKNDEDDEREDNEPQTFFAGGEKSGMLVQDPNAKPRRANELVESILKKAATEGQSREESSESKQRSATHFQGTGFTLGSNQVPSRTIQDANSQVAVAPEEVVERELTFWKNGFSIGDGPLMAYDDPANEKILDDIKSGRAPLKLFNLSFGQRADVKVAHRLTEEYTPPKNVLKTFSGAGQRLGGVVPGESSRPTVSQSSTASTANSTTVVPVSDDKPVTSIQMRLADGTRLVSRFNTTHTVGDLRRFVQNSRPGEAGRSFLLQTTFPVKTLSDDSATLEKAGLLNSVVVQKYI